MELDEVRRENASDVKLGERQSIEELTGGRIRKLPRAPRPRGLRLGEAGADAAAQRGLVEPGEERAAPAGPGDLDAARRDVEERSRVGAALGFREP